MEQSLLRRGEHCLSAVYDPITRQIQLVDGKTELDTTLQLLADDGLLVGEDAWESVAINEAATERWGTNLLTAADHRLHGPINDLPQLRTPVQITVLGLHPHADGTLRGPHAATLAHHQLSVLFNTLGLLTPRN